MPGGPSGSFLGFFSTLARTRGPFLSLSFFSDLVAPRVWSLSLFSMPCLFVSCFSFFLVESA